MGSKLKDILKQHKITQETFKQHVAMHKPRSEEWAKSVLGNKIKLNFQTIKIVVETLRELTQEDIFVQDVIDIPYDKYQYLRIQHEQDNLETNTPELSLVLASTDDEEENGLWLALSDAIESSYPATSPPHKAQSTFTTRGLWFWILIPPLLTLVGGFWLGRHNPPSKMPSPLGGDASISVPRLIGPEGATSDLTPKLRVETVMSANDYEFSIFNLRSRKNVFISNTPNPFYNLPDNVLCPNTPYGWKARAGSNGRWSSFASTMEFFVDDDDHPWHVYAEQDTEPTTPEAIAPNSIVTSLPVTLELSEIEGAIGYGFYLRDLETEHLYDFEFDSTSNLFTLPEGIIEDGHRYGWNARARNCAGFSDFTERLEFEVRLSGER